MKTLKSLNAIGLAFAVSITAAGCAGSDDIDGGNEAEVITTVTLTFTPVTGGAPIIAEFDDPDGDGGEAPTVDDIFLTNGSFAASVSFENRLESPAENITEEILDEADVHQVFFTGSAVNGPASNNPGAALTHTYSDQDANALPIGIENTMLATTGSGQLVVTLRHLPPVGNAPAKTASLAADVADGGFAAIGGNSDAQITFDVTVQ